MMINVFRIAVVAGLFATGFGVVAGKLAAQETAVEDAAVLQDTTEQMMPEPHGEITVTDAPSDNGSKVLVTWIPDPDYPDVDTWVIRLVQDNLEESEDNKGLVLEKRVEAGQDRYDLSFEKLVPGREVSVSAAAATGGTDAVSPYSAPVKGKPRGNLYNGNRTNVLVSLLVFLGLVVIFVEKAKRGATLFIRRIAGLDAVEEAVGRATEMGRPILYVPGLSSMSDVATIAALNILDPIARKAATYETKIIVPNRDPIVYTVAREVVSNAFSAAGRPDMFNDDLVFFITESQFGYAAAVDGIIVRERPATNFYLGMFWAESLVLAETGAATGAIQIAGTDSITQLPFFIVSCDYTLIGEELYAASAYLGQEPVLMGTLKAQDYMKIILLAMSAVAVILAALGNFKLYTIMGLQ